MARIIRHASRLARAARLSRLRVVGGAVLAAAFLAWFVWLNREALRAPSFVLPALSGGFFIWGERGRPAWLRLRAGLSGEKEVRARLGRLPRGVIVETGVCLRTGRAPTEIDCLVVLADEVRVFEVKNVRGRFRQTKDGVRLVRPVRNAGEPADLLTWKRALDVRVAAVRRALGTNNPVRVRGVLVFAGAVQADDPVRNRLSRSEPDVWFTAYGDLQDWVRSVDPPDARAVRAIRRNRDKLSEEAIT